jgi:hypothetical protein
MISTAMCRNNDDKNKCLDFIKDSIDATTKKSICIDPISFECQSISIGICRNIDDY